MTPWREVSAAARARGYFTDEDRTRWRNVMTCPAAEIVQQYGIGEDGSHYYHGAVHHLGNNLCWEMDAKDFDGFDAVLDAMEDTALAIKREAGV